MIRTKLLLALALLLAPPTGLLAQASEPSIHGNVTFISDYVWRGISQTREQAAVQGSLDFERGGFYAGLWGSNVDYGSDAQLELDLSVGYRWSYENGFGWSVGLLESAYFDESELNMLELVVGVEFRGLELTAFYAEDYSGIETDTLYLDLSYDRQWTDRVGLHLHVGHSSFEASSGLVDYLDYAAGVTFSAVGLDFGLTAHGTDLDGVDEADDRVVVSISKSF